MRVLGIDLYFRQGLEGRGIKGRHLGLGGVQCGKVCFGRLQPPVIGVGRAIAPGGPIRLGSGFNGRLGVAGENFGDR